MGDNGVKTIPVKDLRRKVPKDFIRTFEKTFSGEPELLEELKETTKSFMRLYHRFKKSYSIPVHRYAVEPECITCENGEITGREKMAGYINSPAMVFEAPRAINFVKAAEEELHGLFQAFYCFKERCDSLVERYGDMSNRTWMVSNLARSDMSDLEGAIEKYALYFKK
jgi:hypothetical protein